MKYIFILFCLVQLAYSKTLFAYKNTCPWTTTIDLNNKKIFLDKSNVDSTNKIQLFKIASVVYVGSAFVKGTTGIKKLHQHQRRCVNMWDEGCINGQLQGAGNDDYYLAGGGFNPGKRCVNMWDEGCINGQLQGAGNDDYYLAGGGFNPGKRCVNMWDEGCINGQLQGAGNDDYYLAGGGFNPGKRCVNMWDEGCINGQLQGAGNDDYYLAGGGFNPGKRSLETLMEKLRKAHKNN